MRHRLSLSKYEKGRTGSTGHLSTPSAHPPACSGVDEDLQVSIIGISIILWPAAQTFTAYPSHAPWPYLARATLGPRCNQSRPKDDLCSTWRKSWPSHGLQKCSSTMARLSLCRMENITMYMYVYKSTYSLKKYILTSSKPALYLVALRNYS